jgi:hypothetical protein
MPISVTTAMPTSFKVEILRAVHNFTASTGNTFKIALMKATVCLVDIWLKCAKCLRQDMSMLKNKDHQHNLAHQCFLSRATHNSPA